MQNFKNKNKNKNKKEKAIFVNQPSPFYTLKNL
jgi:hypothetical protein